MERWERIITEGEKHATVIDEGPCGLRELEFEGNTPIEDDVLTYFSRSSTANYDVIFVTFLTPTGKNVSSPLTTVNANTSPVVGECIGSISQKRCRVSHPPLRWGDFFNIFEYKILNIKK